MKTSMGDLVNFEEKLQDVVYDSRRDRKGESLVEKTVRSRKIGR